MERIERMQRVGNKFGANLMSAGINLRPAAFFVIAGLSVAGCQSFHQPESPKAPEKIAEQEGWNSTVTVTRSGKPSAVIRFQHMQKFGKERVVQFDNGVVVDFYNNEGQHTSNLVAQEGKMHENSGDVEALGNVVVVSDSGITLFTEHLRWNNRREKIVSEEFVTIATPAGDTLYGHGFESDQLLQNWVILKPTGVSSKKLAIDEMEKPKSNDDSTLSKRKEKF